MDWNVLFDLAQDSAIWDGLSTLAVLPVWLLAACNPDRIRESLSQIVPQFARKQLLLQNCEVERVRYKNDHWTGFYHLLTSLPSDQVLQAVDMEGDIYPPGMGMPGAAQVSGDLGTESWQAVLPDLNLKLRAKEAEKVLISLPFLTDPEQSRQYLMQAIRSGSPQYGDLEIKASHPNVVRYKPGSRCTIVYQLEYAQTASPDRPLPERVVAKTYRGTKGKIAFDSMLAFWNSSLRSSGAVNIAEPLAYDEQERVMLQAAIPEETTLKSFFSLALQNPSSETTARLESTLQKTAVGLAELHRCGVELGHPWAWEDEMAEIRERVDSLSVAYPALAQAVEPLLARLNQLAAVTPPDPLVPSHGSFRPSQVLMYRDQVGFIDFDRFCRSEPANDLAQFLSTLMVNCLTSADDDEQEDAVSPEEPRDMTAREARFALADSLSEKFLAAYQQVHPVSRQRVALWETLHLLMLVLHYWIKVKPAELKGIHFLLERFLQSKNFVRKG